MAVAVVFVVLVLLGMKPNGVLFTIYKTTVLVYNFSYKASLIQIVSVRHCGQVGGSMRKIEIERE